MIVPELFNPNNIVVVGASNDVSKPGGKVIQNLLLSHFKGDILAVNPKEKDIQGLPCVASVNDLPQVDLAVIAIPAQLVKPAIEVLAAEKKTRAFIVLSAGFAEAGKEGKKLESELVKLVDKYQATLIGPNCIGVVTPCYNGNFTSIPAPIDAGGVDFVSGSGATAVFILETAASMGLRLANLVSVGNSAQTGIEEVLAYWDENYEPGVSSPVKLLYMETINRPDLLLKHASSLVRKGCRLAAVKAGVSEAGSRAASSHTGAMATPDKAVDALFAKAGIVRCQGREDLVYTAAVFMHPPLSGPSLAIITHAGGPAVMLTDALSAGGLQVPALKGKAADELRENLFPGSSTGNPIDFLATGTAAQLDLIIASVEDKFPEIDGMAVIFGTPGLFRVFDAYEVLHRRRLSSKKPIFPILPSTQTAAEEMTAFAARGNLYFQDEVVFARSLAAVMRQPGPAEVESAVQVDRAEIRKLIEGAPDGYLPPETVQKLLDAAGIPRVAEYIAASEAELKEILSRMSFPLVMKVVGPLHKSDVGGVVLGIDSAEAARDTFKRLMKIKQACGVLLQPMIRGRELFAGAKQQPGFGHLLMCGLGGIFVEVFKDTASCLVPVGSQEADAMIRSLRSYPLFKGARGGEGINQEAFVQVLLRLSSLLEAAPEILEMDLNPLLGTSLEVRAVDARISIRKN